MSQVNAPRLIQAIVGLFILTIGTASRARAVPPPGTIITVAGIGTGDGGPITAAALTVPFGVAIDAVGNLFIADSGDHRIRKVDPRGTITTVAGNGKAGFSVDGGPAIAATLSRPSGVAVDAAGDVFVVDSGNYRVRKVDPKGVITTVAGGAQPRDGLGDNGPATEAALSYFTGMAVDASGDLFITDSGDYRIRKVIGVAVSANSRLPGDLLPRLPSHQVEKRVAVSANSRLPGDLDGDGKVSITDATLALRDVVGWER